MMMLKLEDIRRQIAQDFSQISVHSSCTKELNNRYEVLVYLAIADYVDLRIKENKRKKIYSLADGVEKWGCGQMAYADLLNRAKTLILQTAQKGKVKEVLVDRFYEPVKADEKNPVKRAFSHIFNCFHAAFCLRLDG